MFYEFILDSSTLNFHCTYTYLLELKTKCEILKSTAFKEYLRELKYYKTSKRSPQ